MRAREVMPSCLGWDDDAFAPVLTCPDARCQTCEWTQCGLRAEYDFDPDPPRPKRPVQDTRPL